MGNHVICSLYGIEFSRLDDLETIQAAFDKAVEEMRATVLHKFGHQFSPQGVTVLYALAESHISCHTFPEKGSVALDCYTCGEMDPRVGMEVLVKFFNPESTTMKSFPR